MHWSLCMYVCIYALIFMYVCIYAYMYVCIYALIFIMQWHTLHHCTWLSVSRDPYACVTWSMCLCHVIHMSVSRDPYVYVTWSMCLCHLIHMSAYVYHIWLYGLLTLVRSVSSIELSKHLFVSPPSACITILPYELNHMALSKMLLQTWILVHEFHKAHISVCFIAVFSQISIFWFFPDMNCKFAAPQIYVYM